VWYKLTMNESWMDYEVMDRNQCKWTPFIMWSCFMSVYVASPPFVTTSFMRSDGFGLVWISLMNSMAFDKCLDSFQLCLFISYPHQWTRYWSWWFDTFESKTISILYFCLPLIFTCRGGSWILLGMVGAQ
jgi:hypothetical protein